MEIILSIFLTLEVKSYLILINIWEIVRILVISEKSDLGTHSVGAKSKFPQILTLETYGLMDFS